MEAAIGELLKDFLDDPQIAAAARSWGSIRS